MTALDISAAWTVAQRLVARARDMLVAVAGVFFLLPGLLFAVVVPEPDGGAGVTPEALVAQLSAIYAQFWPLAIAVGALQMAGVLIVIVIMTDPARPTVGQAIRRGARATMAYLTTQLILAGALGLALLLSGIVAALAGSQALAATLVVVVFALAGWAGLRLALVAPVLAMEREPSSVVAMLRSWQLTRGQALRLGLFLALAALVFLLVYGLVMMFTGVVLVLAAGGGLQKVLAATMSSALTAAAMVYLCAILAAVYRQLAGPDQNGLIATFE